MKKLIIEALVLGVSYGLTVGVTIVAGQMIQNKLAMKALKKSMGDAA